MEQKDVLKALQRDHAAELKLAAKRLKGTARHTEIIPSRTLSELTGHEILLKPENLQVTGSFKIRGAYNKIASLSEEQIARGIVTASAGNHAQGVAYAARERHAKATICMPQITPPLKVDATKAYGADVVLYGDVFDEAAAHAAELASTQGMIYVPPFDDYEVICGQGTIGLEILEDVPNVTDVVVPLGGGGLGAGVALAIKTFKPEVRVIGAIPEGSPAWKNSFAAGRVTEADQVVTSAEGVAVKHPGDLPFALLNEFMDDLVTVTERDINEMILLMLEKHKLVIEAAGAVSLAALEHLNLRSRKFASATGPHVVVPIMSGGNIDTVTMGAVIQKGMIARGRIMNFEVELPDTPGQLVKVAQLLARERANVIALDHDQFKASGHYTNAVSLGVTVETNGPDHIDHTPGPSCPGAPAAYKPAVHGWPLHSRAATAPLLCRGDGLVHQLRQRNCDVVANQTRRETVALRAPHVHDGDRHSRLCGHGHDARRRIYFQRRTDDPQLVRARGQLIGFLHCAVRQGLSEIDDIGFDQAVAGHTATIGKRAVAMRVGLFVQAGHDVGGVVFRVAFHTV